MKNQYIILFDGKCNFCNGTVKFILDRDKSGHFYYSSLESKFAKQLMHNLGIEQNDPDTIVLVHNNKFYTKSRAVLEIVKLLGGLWPLLYIFILLPDFFSNYLYDKFAHHRYKLFGKSESCFIPDENVKKRFLE